MRILFYVLTAGVCLAGDHGDHNWPVRDQETIQKTMTLAGEPMRLVVDNLSGFVHVKGISGSEVRVSAHKVIRAETDSDLSLAKSEVNLQMTQQPGTVSVYYDAPWRCRNNSNGCHDNQRRFYNVVYDIDVEVPVAARLVISTINEGDIHIDGASGNFEVNNINGGIQMNGIGGSGSAHTINGPVSVHFTKGPASECSFKSINGALDVWLPSGAQADLQYKTFNGGIFTDFEVAPRALPASATTERRDGKFVYRSNGGGAGRISNGGPELKFETLNGSIRIHREDL